MKNKTYYFIDKGLSMRGAFRGGNMGFRSMTVKSDSSEIDYSNLLIAQIGVANKFKASLNPDRLLETRSIENNRKVFEDSSSYLRLKTQS